MIIDFTQKRVDIDKIKVRFSWEQEILDFIKTYQQNDTVTAQTSGSTGEPKKILLPKKAMRQSARLTASFLELKKGDTALLCLPVHYIAGKMMLVRAMEIGLKLVCIEPKVEVKVQQDIDFAALTPMQAEKSIAHLSQVRKLILGGAPVSKNVEKKLASLPTISYETYGMTETITHIALRKLNQEKVFTCLEEMQIRTDNRRCLVIKTPYFSEEILTNDIVQIQSPKQFKWQGRADNIINSGGLKINPEEIEEALKSILKAPFVISGIEDKTLGNKLVLVIEGTPTNINIASAELPKNKTPKEIIFLPEFQRTASGKIRRKWIKEKINTK